MTNALPNIPVLIFTYSEQPDPALHQQAWAAALVLMAFVLVASLRREGTARPQPQKAGPVTGSFTIAPVIDVAAGKEGRSARAGGRSSSTSRT